MLVGGVFCLVLIACTFHVLERVEVSTQNTHIVAEFGVVV